MATVKYRPANGDEGLRFMARWCDNCKRGPKEDSLEDCDILARSFCLKVEDPNYPVEWQGPIDKPWDHPVCTAYEEEPKP